ncbi:uncharacterized protein rnf214 [Stigmatopora argus]
MEANTETVVETSFDACENLIIEDIIGHHKSAQTDATASAGLSMADAGVNTAADWEEQLKASLEVAEERAAEEDQLVKRRQYDDEEREKTMALMQEKKMETQREYQALIEKMNSVRMQLKLNNSKITDENFESKKQQFSSEKTSAEDEKKRLSDELEELTAKLSALTREQQEEKDRWDVELIELKKEMERVRQEAEESESAALRHQIRAVEVQRDVAVKRIEACLAEMSEYVSSLQPADQDEKASWASKETVVRRNLTELQECSRDVLAKLKNRHQLDSLPCINMPTLPPIPTTELKLQQMISRLPAAPPPMSATQLPDMAPPSEPDSTRPQMCQEHYPPPPPVNRLEAAASSTTVLSMLRTRFPHISEMQLKQLLKQVKNKHGTLAGRSVKDVGDQIDELLA